MPTACWPPTDHCLWSMSQLLVGHCNGVACSSLRPPPLEALAEEMRRLVQLNAQKRPALVSFFRQEGRRRPEYTAWSYVLSDTEDALRQETVALFDTAGLKLVALMFDGAIVRPAATRQAVNLETISDQMAHKVHIMEKPFPRPSFGVQVKKRLRSLRSWKTLVPGPGDGER